MTETKPKYSEEDLDRIERESEALISEAQDSLGRAHEFFKRAGLAGAGGTATEFFRRHGPSEEMDRLRLEHLGDANKVLMQEERRLLQERQEDGEAPGRPKRRRRMTPI